MIESSSSRRQLPTQRSATPFCQGTWMPVRVGSRPAAFMTQVTLPSNVESWSKQHEAVRTIARKHVPQLLHHPRGRRLAGHVEMQNLAAIVFDDEEAREQLEGQRGGGEEIAGA